MSAFGGKADLNHDLAEGAAPAAIADRVVFSFGQRVSGSYAFLPLGFLAFARFFVSGLAEGLGSAKQRHIRHNILMSI